MSLILGVNESLTTCCWNYNENDFDSLCQFCLDRHDSGTGKPRVLCCQVNALWPYSVSNVFIKNIGLSVSQDTRFMMSYNSIKDEIFGMLTC